MLRTVYRRTLAGLGVAAVFVLLVVVRYPGRAEAAWTGPAAGATALLALLAVAAPVAWATVRRRGVPRPAHAAAVHAAAVHAAAVHAAAVHAAAVRAGVAAGLAAGALWVGEIGFNNLVDPRVSTASARGWVDNGVWAVVNLVIFGVAARQARHADRAGAGVRAGVTAGLWAGLVSGLLACLAALLLVVAGMPFLLRDPLNVREYLARGAAGGAPDPATYVAYQTLAGAMGHLVLLGLVFGVVLGGLGGALARGVAAIRRVHARRVPPRGTPDAHARRFATRAEIVTTH